jgi:hypothetical protein
MSSNKSSLRQILDRMGYDLQDRYTVVNRTTKATHTFSTLDEVLDWVKGSSAVAGAAERLKEWAQDISSARR